MRDGQAVARRLGDTNRARHDGAEDEIAEVAANLALVGRPVRFSALSQPAQEAYLRRLAFHQNVKKPSMYGLR